MFIFLILESENLSGFPDKISAFHLEGLSLMKCHFTLTAFMERTLFSSKIKEFFHYYDDDVTSVVTLIALFC